MSGNEQNQWHEKLVGKYIVEDDAPTTLSEGEYVRVKDLPKPNRVLFANSIITMDYRTERLNVHVDDNMKVKGVSYG
ncbi:hypothetical protein RMATCC62417_14530 [Rhizopus microsporus]|nr:hypothetical protein RMATCC62417_14530 [Rhizopus microsporus]